jgi:TatD DNase family protein
MIIVDCHTHLYDDKFANEQQFNQILQEAQNNHVHKIIVVSEDEPSSHKVLALCKQHSHILKPSLGLHPCNVHSRDQIQRMVTLVRQHANEIVCIGEVGLDFTPGILKDTATRYDLTVEEVKELQKEALVEFCKLSIELDLALNVHSRSAGRPCLNLLKENKVQKAMLHAFDGSVKVAKQGIQEGYMFSIPANICRSEHFENLAKAVPIDNLLIETDSPALLPQLPDHTTTQELEEKLRNAKNEPKNALLSVQKVAQSKQLSIEQVAELTTKNASILYPRVFIDQ